jgi:hypothetical protein
MPAKQLKGRRVKNSKGNSGTYDETSTEYLGLYEMRGALNYQLPARLSGIIELRFEIDEKGLT